MQFDGAQTGGVQSSGVKSAGFDYSYAFKDNNQDEEEKVKYQDVSVWTQSVAFNHSNGTRDDGAFNGRFEQLG